MRPTPLLLAFGWLGCEATVPTPQPHTLNQPPTSAALRHTGRNIFWRPLQIRYLGDGAHRSIELIPLLPARVRIVDHRNTRDAELPQVLANYLVPADETIVRFQARDRNHLACYGQFAVLQAMAVGRTAEIVERRMGATCEILVLLVRNDACPLSTDGRETWGAQSEPPTDPPDETLP